MTGLYKAIANIYTASDFRRSLYTLFWLPSIGVIGNIPFIVMGNITMILVLKSGRWKDHLLKIWENADVKTCSHYFCFVTFGWMASQSLHKGYSHFLQVSPKHTMGPESQSHAESIWLFKRTDNKEHQSLKRGWLK